MTDNKEIAWNLSLVFKSDEEIENTINQIKKESTIVENFRGKIDNENMTPEKFLESIKTVESLLAKSIGLFSYSSNKVSANQFDKDANILFNKVKNIYTANEKKTAFIELELGKLLSERGDEFINSPILKDYKHYLEITHNLSKYRLSEQEEQLILEKDLTGATAWSQLQGERLGKKKFTAIIDGSEKEFSWSEAQGLMHNPDKNNRKNTIVAVTEALKEEADTFAAALRNICTNHVSMSKLRNYESTMTSSLLRNDVNQPMIDNLEAVLRENLDIFHDFLKIKAKIMKTDKLQGEDLWAPFPQVKSKNYPWEETKELILTAFKDYDDKFVKIAQKMFDMELIDASPRKGKRGGAYCSSNYITKECYILQSYSGTMDDVTTLAHELGHAVHGNFVMKSQPMVNYSYSFCIAECASEFARFLVVDKLKNIVSEEEKKEILFKQLEEFCIVIYEVASRILFEKSLYRAIENGEYLDAEKITNLFAKSRKDYFGEAIEFLPEQDSDWMWKPHYFRNTLRFYNYPYVFAELTVLSLYNKYKKEGDSFKPKFENFLAAGASKSPEELVKDMGMDLMDRNFWKMGFDEIRTVLTDVKLLF